MCGIIWTETKMTKTVKVIVWVFCGSAKVSCSCNLLNWTEVENLEKDDLFHDIQCFFVYYSLIHRAESTPELWFDDLKSVDVCDVWKFEKSCFFFSLSFSFFFIQTFRVLSLRWFYWFCAQNRSIIALIEIMEKI